MHAKQNLSCSIVTYFKLSITGTNINLYMSKIKLRGPSLTTKFRHWNYVAGGLLTEINKDSKL